MTAYPPLVPGAEIFLRGDVTQNTWVGANSARKIERNLGFRAGRLDAGWAVLVLKQALSPGDFKFSGLTLRSGGRAGLPAASWEADKLRPHVTDDMLARMGAAAYRAMQVAALAKITPTGPQRLVKVVPVTPHSEAMSPEEQYPMGGGGLQWTLLKPCKFLVAMTVDAAAIARIPGFSAYLGESASYDDRARLARHIASA